MRTKARTAKSLPLSFDEAAASAGKATLNLSFVYTIVLDCVPVRMPGICKIFIIFFFGRIRGRSLDFAKVLLISYFLF